MPCSVTGCIFRVVRYALMFVHRAAGLGDFAISLSRYEGLLMMCCKFAKSKALCCMVVYFLGAVWKCTLMYQSVMYSCTPFTGVWLRLLILRYSFKEMQPAPFSPIPTVLTPLAITTYDVPHRSTSFGRKASLTWSA